MSTSTDPADEHTTDAADLEVRSDGEHAPIVDDAANLAPGQVGSHVDPDTVGTAVERSAEEREQVVEQVREEHD